MKEEIIRFLGECIAGKTLVTDEVVYKLEDGNLEGVYYLDGGKVVFEYLPTHSGVNPDTLEKTLSEGHYPPYVSREKSI